MKLATINSWLWLIGLVMVVAIGNDGEPTRIWIERWKTYQMRPNAQPDP